ncbi:hypothetical protein Tco_0653637 [Tanacetum coccineum]|uniref:Uncharacterized protein n=1 Tax=Tanacetum coccineum TaxID=301880 RepID=A0ABQ4X1D2_9ASTR
MVELILKKYMENAQAESNPTKPNTEDDINTELSKEFLMELKNNAYHGMFDEDVVDHIATVLELLDLIKIPCVDSHRLGMKVFPLVLADDARQCWNKRRMDNNILNNKEWKESNYGNPLNTATDSFFKAHDEHDIEEGNELRQMKRKEYNKNDEQPNKKEINTASPYGVFQFIDTAYWSPVQFIVLAGKEIDKVGEVSIIWNPVCVVVMLNSSYLDLRKKMDNPNITMEEYIRLEEEKAHRRGKVYNWETATYGPGLQPLTARYISSGLVRNSVSQSKKDYEILFQPLFNEYFNPLPRAVSPDPVVVTAPRAIDPVGSPSSTTIDQDVPSASTSPTNQEIQSQVIHQGVEEQIHGHQNAQFDNAPLLHNLSLDLSYEETTL